MFLLSNALFALLMKTYSNLVNQIVDVPGLKTFATELLCRKVVQKS